MAHSSLKLILDFIIRTYDRYQKLPGSITHLLKPIVNLLINIYKYLLRYCPIQSIYPINIPGIIFHSGQDLILIDLPARSIAQMPAGFAYVHNALKKTQIKFQTVDLDIIIYHRFHSRRILEGLTEIRTPNGRLLPEDPWQPVHYLDWENPDVIEYFRPEIEEIVNGLTLAQPRMIAFSIQQVNLSFTKEVVKEVRLKLPNVVVIVGGMSCLQPLAAKIAFNDADYTVVGEADLTIGPLVEALARGEHPHDLRGIWSRFDSHGRTLSQGPMVEDLDTLDFPRYEWTDIQLYRNWNGYNLTPIVGSRGCSWGRCTFCGERFHWRTHSPEYVVNEMQWLYEQGFNNFVFNESDLHGKPELIEQMCEEIIRRGMKVHMTAQLRCNAQTDKSYYKKLYSAGFRTLRFGVDAASSNTLKLQRKGYNKETIRRTIMDASEAGIFVQINLVVGVPGETEQDIDESIEFITELKNYIGEVAFINPFMLFRGSEYWENPEKFGMVFNSNKEELYTKYLVAIPDAEWYSTSPYIDKGVRYSRFVKVVSALKILGVKMGDFADYTSKAVEQDVDLANTHDVGSSSDHRQNLNVV